MYSLREDLFERDADDSLLTGSESMLSPGSSQPSPPSKRTSLCSFTPPSHYDDDEDELFFPSYEGGKDTWDAGVEYPVDVSPCLSEPVACFREPASPGLLGRTEDDSAAREEPERHVDYLSHEWTEEDIWSSYKFIRSSRDVYPNSARLENASWRTWEQKRRNLKTVSPETVDWLKDHDVTWLYGPLQPGFCSLDQKCISEGRLRYSDSDSELNKKPCLKKKTLSELILQQFISSGSLLRQAGSQKRRQESGSTEDSSMYDPTHELARSASAPSSEIPPSNSSFPSQSPWLSKSVRFHELVERRIALSHFGEDESDYHYVSDSEDDIYMTKTTKHWVSSTNLRKNTPPSKTLGILPHATLKSPEPEETRSVLVGLGISRGAGRNQTGRSLTKPSSAFFREDVVEESVEYWKAPKWLQNRKDSVQILQDKLEAMKLDAGDNPPTDHSCNSLSLNPNLVGPTKEARDSSIRFELPPCRSQLASFSFPSFTNSSTRNCDRADEDKSCWSADVEFACPDPDDSESSDEYEHISSTPVLSSAKTALINRVMEQLWMVFNAQDYARTPVALSLPQPRDWDMSRNCADNSPNSRARAESLRQSLSILVRKRVEVLVHEQHEADEALILASLSRIIQDCQDQVQAAYASDDTEDIDHYLATSPYCSISDSPATSSDSGYGSEKERVRDRSREEVEKEKGVRDWELYSGSWDDDEALAWESAF